MPAKKTAAKKATTVRNTTAKKYVAKVYIAPGPDGSGGFNMGDKVPAKQAKEIAETQGVKLSDLFK